MELCVALCNISLIAQYIHKLLELMNKKNKKQVARKMK